jgi:hypothetical protein
VDWGTRLPVFRAHPGNLPEGKREDEGTRKIGSLRFIFPWENNYFPLSNSLG